MSCPPDALVEDEWQVHHQIVVPRAYRKTVIGLAHDTPMSGHLGINETYHKVLAHFLAKDEKGYSGLL
jgi:hypothetical protein